MAMACVETILENRIDELHDDILVHILSMLMLKEAGQTSILSKRWRDLWAYVPTLKFDNDKFLLDFLQDENVLAFEEEEPKYVRWVDQVMSSHKAPTIDEFKVQFNLHSSRKGNVDSWLRSAMEKRVKRFHLDIGPVLCDCWDGQRLFYTFPSLSFNSLNSLQLAQVDVSGEVLEKLLHDCPLEYLSVSSSQLLENLKVAGPSLKLKSLKLTYVTWPEDALEISAPNLTSFDYCGSILSFPFKSIPKLTEFSIGDEYATHLMYDFSSLSSYASQIEVLTLDANYYMTAEHIRIAEPFPVCSRLKLLNILIVPKFDDQMFGLLSLIKACPLLHKFVLKFLGHNPEVKRTEETRNIEACPHPCLKIVEIIDFVGWELDYGFVECLIVNAVSLEKIIIEPRENESTDEPRLEERKRRARLRAEQLRSNLKPGTELEIRNPEP